MNKNYLLSAILLIGISFSVNAQNKNLCASAQTISSFPFSQTGLTTNGATNDITTAPCAGTVLDGVEFLFKYTPTANQNVSVTLTNTMASLINKVGLFVTKDCPNASGAVCMGFVESTSNPLQLPSISLIAGETYYIMVTSKTTLPFGSSYTNFDISLANEIVLNGIDAGISAIKAIEPSCNLGASNVVEATVFNYGDVSISNVPVQYTVNNGTPILDTVDGPILPNASAVVTFVPTVDLSLEGSYSIEVKTNYPNDTIPENNAMIFVAEHQPLVTLPYLADFENDNGHWGAGGVNSTWEWGVPNNTMINSAFSGTKAWVTNLDGNNHADLSNNSDENSFLYSPCFDFTGVVHPQIKFQVRTKLNITDMPNSVRFQWSNDNGSTWVTLRTWNGTIEDWTLFEYSVDTIAGMSNVRFRFSYAPSFTMMVTPSEGFAIDDFQVYEQQACDFQTIDIIATEFDCGMSSQTPVTAKIMNVGLNDQNTVMIAYSTNQIDWEVDTLYQLMHPFDTITHIFNTPANFSTIGSYTLYIKTINASDIITINDMKSMEINNLPVISAFPYNENFNVPTSNWFTYGIKSSWEYGQSTLGNNTSNIWATNLTGNYNGGELSYLQGPCFDVSTMTNPYFNFKYWVEFGEGAASGGVDVEASTDGITWNPLNILPYNLVSTSWMTSSLSLNSVKTATKLQIRFVLISSVLGTQDGIFIDDVSITEGSLIGQDENSASVISVYPNPTSDNVFVNSSNEKITKIEIIGIDGKTIISKEINDFNATLNVENTDSGLYFLRISTTSRTQMSRFIVQ
ncbi:MAG: T9SS type A sorting domain-containing protein [Bacteroidota bacterium]